MPCDTGKPRALPGAGKTAVGGVLRGTMRNATPTWATGLAALVANVQGRTGPVLK
jgi:hypothetical protein